jgi:hypothetical protein
LIQLDASEQGFEVAFAETLVPLARDQFEEHRPDHVLGKDLQQQALARGRRAVEENATTLDAASHRRQDSSRLIANANPPAWIA